MKSRLKDIDAVSFLFSLQNGGDYTVEPKKDSAEWVESMLSMSILWMTVNVNGMSTEQCLWLQ